MSKTLKKAPKKIKTLVLKTGKNRVSTLETMKNPWEHTKTKKLQVKVNNSNVKKDSDYETSSSDSDDDDDKKFNPIIELGNRKVIEAKKEPLKFNGVDIPYIPTDKDCIEERFLMKEGIIPRGYSNCIMSCGSIGSGKSNQLCAMLLSPLIFGPDNTGKPFYDNLFIFTNSTDDVYDVLIEHKVLKPENIVYQPKVKDLDLVLKRQEEAMERCNGDLCKMPVLCIIYDDIIDNQDFVKSKSFLLTAIRPRQLLCCTIILTQFCNAIPRRVRMQCQNLILFQGTKTEEELYTDWLCPASMNKKEFQHILKTAWEKTPTDRHPFLHVNRKMPLEKRFYRNFNTLIKV